MLCWNDHHLVHEQRWRLEPLGTGHFVLTDPNGNIHPLRPPHTGTTLFEHAPRPAAIAWPPSLDRRRASVAVEQPAGGDARGDRAGAEFGLRSHREFTHVGAPAEGAQEGIVDGRPHPRHLLIRSASVE